MKIDNPSGDPDFHAPQYQVQFEAREVSDLVHHVPEQAFEAVRRVSEINEALYSTFVSPWVHLMTTPVSAEMLRWMHPTRTSRLMFSEKFNPWMRLIQHTANNIADTRQPLEPDDPMILLEQATIAAVGEAIERARIARDARLERTFRTLYSGDTSEIRDDAKMPGSTSTACFFTEHRPVSRAQDRTHQR